MLIPFGVKPCEFGRLTVREIRSYLMARQAQFEEKNLFCYLQGIYFHDAIAVNLQNALGKGKKSEYHKEPIRLTPITEKEKAEQEEKELQELISYLNGFKENFDKKEVAI